LLSKVPMSNSLIPMISHFEESDQPRPSDSDSEVPVLPDGKVDEVIEEVFEKDKFYYFSELVFLVSPFTAISECPCEHMGT
jgi:hypothetical protein